MSHCRIRGIMCRLQTPIARRALGKVLDRIRAAQQEDYECLLKLVREVVPLSPEEAKDGTGGEWKPDKQPDYDGTNWYDYDPSGRTQGILYIHEDLPRRELVANLAHELGHTCTTDDDLEARQSPEDEWASEWAADWYAVKRWGFGPEIDASRDTRAWLHHGPQPGETFTTETGEYYLNDDFVCHRSA